MRQAIHFATTTANTMRNNLQRSGFTRVGQDWKGMPSLGTIIPDRAACSSIGKPDASVLRCCKRLSATGIAAALSAKSQIGHALVAAAL